MLDDWYSYFNQCSECRRCSVFCPYGIDTAEITMAAREIMDSVGMGQKYTNEIIGKVHRSATTWACPGPALEDTLEGLEEDIKEETGVDVRFPLDVQGRRGAAGHAVGRLLLRAARRKPDRLRQGVPRRRHQLDAVSSHASEAGNFGMFIGNYEQMRKIALRVREAALELGVKRIVVGECGHAWRVAYSFWNTLIGPFDCLDPRYPVPQHICEFTYDLIQRGALQVRQGSERRPHRHLPRLVQRGARLAHGRRCPAASS